MRNYPYGLIFLLQRSAKIMNCMMTKEQFQREKNYQASRAVVKSMLNNGVITEKEYKKIDTKLVGRYRPLFGSI